MKQNKTIKAQPWIPDKAQTQKAVRWLTILMLKCPKMKMKNGWPQSWNLIIMRSQSSQKLAILVKLILPPWAKELGKGLSKWKYLNCLHRKWPEDGENTVSFVMKAQELAQKFLLYSNVKDNLMGLKGRNHLPRGKSELLG